MTDPTSTTPIPIAEQVETMARDLEASAVEFFNEHGEIPSPTFHILHGDGDIMSTGEPNATEEQEEILPRVVAVLASQVKAHMIASVRLLAEEHGEALVFVFDSKIRRWGVAWTVVRPEDGEPHLEERREIPAETIEASYDHFSISPGEKLN